MAFRHSNRAVSRFAHSQWETALLRNDVSHWLCAKLESACNHVIYHWQLCPKIGERHIIPRIVKNMNPRSHNVISHSSFSPIYIYIYTRNHQFQILLTMSVELLQRRWQSNHFWKPPNKSIFEMNRVIPFEFQWIGGNHTNSSHSRFCGPWVGVTKPISPVPLFS